MHAKSLHLMREGLGRWTGGAVDVLDVGSLDINGSFKPLVESLGHSYVGLDLVEGRNVDIVSTDPFHYPVDNESYDILISGSTMEHVTFIWEWIPELVRILKRGGLLVITTHTAWAYHEHPVDCWRIMPGGFEVLFDMTEELEDYMIRQDGDRDIIGSAFRKE